MLTQHPLSSAWPSMAPDEYQVLKDSIEVIGVQNPITLFEGMVIDGWHRYKGATELGLHCPSKLLGDVDPVDFVRSQNDARRHITASQKALAITAIYAWMPAGKPAPGAALGKSSAEMAAIEGISERTIRQAKAVNEKATADIKDAVKAGTMSVKKAAETVKPKKDKPPKASKPTPEPVAKPAVDPTEDYTDLDAAQDHIHELQAMLAVANMGNVPEEEKTQAASLITELQKENKSLRINLKAVTRSRDQLQNELAQVKKQCVSQQNKLKRLSHD